MSAVHLVPDLDGGPQGSISLCGYRGTRTTGREVVFFTGPKQFYGTDDSEMVTCCRCKKVLRKEGRP